MKKEKMETKVWEGQQSFERFVEVFETLGYRYIVVCNTKKKLAFACPQNDLMDTCEMLNERKIMYSIFQINEPISKVKAAA